AVVLLGAASGVASASAASNSPSQEITVCPTCSSKSITAALAQAAPNQRIIVDGGSYPGNLTIERPVTLIGVNNPIINAGGQGSGVTIKAPGVTFQGFTVRDTGISLDHEDTGIAVQAKQATVVDNHVDDSLFGIYLKNAHGSIIRDNVVTSKKGLEVGERGDPIRVWYSNNVQILGNRALDGRDVILWFSNDGVVRNNVFERDRYGLHLMFSDRALIEGNALRGNSIGLYIMYSNDDVVRSNLLTDNHGSTGMGLGMTGDDGTRIEGNRIVSNRIGVQVAESPYSPASQVSFTGNVFAYNGTGIGFMPNVQRNVLVGNAFIDNIEQVSVLGGGQLQGNTWTVNGRGNYWSDYAGFDANGDGIGDLPYRSQDLFDSLIDAHDSFRLFLFSPAVTAIDFAAKAFPDVRPQTKLVDAGPLMKPVLPAGLPAMPSMTTSHRFELGTLGILTVIGGLAMIVSLRRRPLNPEPRLATPGASPAGASGAAAISPAMRAAMVSGTSDPIVRARGLTKCYGRAAAVDQASFEIAPGDALALWGPNGAGKTTVLRCLLGVAQYDGDVTVAGLQPKCDGRVVRQRIGYVPQELPVPPMSVGEMTRFIADLKHVPFEKAVENLEMLAIADQRNKPVGALSGGMRQRLALALALIGKPSMLLLDEPTANLDANGRTELLELLRRLKREGLTLIFSSHRPEDVLMLADRILTIERGVIQEELLPEHFLRNLEANACLVLYGAEEASSAAVAALNTLGVKSTHHGGTVTAALGGRSKWDLIRELVLAGIDMDDFETERGSWTGQ
ncbi:MAG TPA: nitrous oxide reductase family maturation protein NosD, partial [Thermomicrobiaceae bacterium]|nr:nitrous oxide reductase family maturation protein NosD [Thermomicrobiaceae bacterium]